MTPNTQVRAILLAFLLSLAAPGLAAGDSAGTHANGSFVMGAFGNATDFRDEFVTDLGLSLHAGDVLHYNWTANGGSGPSVYFEIHAHVPRFTLFRNATAASESGSWEVPGTNPYMIFWRNLNNVSVNVTYAYDVTPAPTNWLLPTLGLVSAATAVAIVALVVLRRRHRGPAAP